MAWPGGTRDTPDPAPLGAGPAARLAGSGAGGGSVPSRPPAGRALSGPEISHGVRSPAALARGLPGGDGRALWARARPLMAPATGRDRSCQDGVALGGVPAGRSQGRPPVEGPARPTPPRLGHSEPALAIRTLGSFAVAVGGRPISPSAWQSRKARTLLKFLVVRRGVPVAREALAQLLWPDDVMGAQRKLAVTISTVRRILDPQERYSSGHFVASNRACLWLEVTSAWVDLYQFEELARQGLRGDDDGGPLLEAAESLYRGDFLEEDLYEDWAAGVREGARGLYLDVVHRLAALSGRAGRWEDAAARYRRILEWDPYDEEAHLALVAILVSQGRYGQARRAYRLYAQRMEDLALEAVPFHLAVGTIQSGDGAAARDRGPSSGGRSVGAAMAGPRGI
jgi:DNA-binding SARP family transcriptional activator